MKFSEGLATQTDECPSAWPSRPHCRRDTENTEKLPPLHDRARYKRCYRIGVDQCSGRGLDRLHATYFDGSVANAFRTFDCETPNCRAIRVGAMPALNAARIAFTLPCANETSAMSTFRLAVDCNRFFVNPDGRRADGVTSVLTLDGNRPRRFASSNTASKSSSNSPSLNCPMA